MTSKYIIYATVLDHNIVILPPRWLATITRQGGGTSRCNAMNLAANMGLNLACDTFTSVEKVLVGGATCPPTSAESNSACCP